jgi:short-subunit dehydrogenase
MGMRANFQKRYGAWAVVTGASSGIGREIARQIAAEQVNVVLVSRNVPAMEELRLQIVSTCNAEVRVIASDLSQPKAAGELWPLLEGLPIGLFVHSAGFGAGGPFLEHEPSLHVDMLEVNCRSLIELAHGFGRRFAAQKRGGIVLLSSVLAFQGVPRSAVYAATKAFVQTLGEGLAKEWKRFGVDVLISAPGPTSTGFAKRAGMRFGTAADPEVVAQGTLNALGWRTMVLPAWNARLLYAALMTTPRSIRTQIMSKVIKSMT